MDRAMHPPSFQPCARRRRWRHQRGVMIVEFALIAMLFFSLLLGIMEFGRWMFTLNAAAEATRWGARLAVVCAHNETQIAQIKQRMRALLSDVSNAQIVIAYSPAACDTAACIVTVSLVNATFTPLIPYFGVPVSIPPFTTSLSRESMDSSENPDCL